MNDQNAVTIKDVPLSCQHCGGNSFKHRCSQLNTAVMTFFGFDWLNASADVYVCDNCGYLHWFLGSSKDNTNSEKNPSPEENTIADDSSLASECLSCGEVIPQGADTCPKCRWSYRPLKEPT